MSQSSGAADLGMNPAVQRMSAFKGIVQVCQVTRDLDRSMAKWIDLYGAGPFFVADFSVEGHHYRGRPVTATVRVGMAYCGPVMIELAQPQGSDPSIYHEVLGDRSEALHHFWRAGGDFDAEVKRYAALGCPVVAGGPIPGMGRQAFVDTMASIGAFTELLEAADWVYGTLDNMRNAHRDWDGSEPIRPYSAILPKTP